MTIRITSTVQAEQLVNSLKPFGITHRGVEEIFAQVVDNSTKHLRDVIHHDYVMNTNEAEAALLNLKNAVHNYNVIRNLFN